jgi:hypothetical protein
MRRTYDDIIMEGVKIMGGPFRNFSGTETPMNRAGDRNFCVLIPDNMVQRMLEDGLNVKYTKPEETDEGDVEPGSPFLKIKVNFSSPPPKIIMRTETGGPRPLTEDMVEILDSANIVFSDMIVRPWPTTYAGKPVLPIYLQSLVVVIKQDYLDEKWSRIDDEREEGMRHG